MKYEICYKLHGKEYCTGYGSFDKTEAENVAEWLSGIMFPYDFYVIEGKYCDDGSQRCVPLAYINNINKL